MNWRTYRVWPGVVLFTCVLLGAGPASKPAATQSVVMRSADGTLAARLPGGWAQVQPAKAGYDLQAVNADHQALLYVSAVGRPAKVDLEGFGEKVRGPVVAGLSDVKVTEWAKAYVNEKSALRCEVAGTRKGVPLGYVLTVVDTGQHLMAVIAACDGELFGKQKKVLGELAGAIVDVDTMGSLGPANAAAAAKPAQAQGLTNAIALETTDPAGAYAALRAIARQSPKSEDGQGALKELGQMEGNADVVKRVLAGEGKAYGHYVMAQNFEKSGKPDMARARYEQLLRDYPDTLSAHLAVKKMEDALK